MDSSHSMKSCALILLVALLCAEKAQGLQCYRCQPESFGTYCYTTTCPYSDGFCVTQEAEVIVDSYRRKVKNSQCLPFCPADLENKPILDPIPNMKTYCCQEDLCNAAVPTGGSSWTTAGVLLFSLGSVLLQTLL